MFWNLRKVFIIFFNAEIDEIFTSAILVSIENNIKSIYVCSTCHLVNLKLNIDFISLCYGPVTFLGCRSGIPGKFAV